MTARTLAYLFLLAIALIGAVAIGAAVGEITDSLQTTSEGMGG